MRLSQFLMQDKTFPISHAGWDFSVFSLKMRFSHILMQDETFRFSYATWDFLSEGWKKQKTRYLDRFTTSSRSKMFMAKAALTKNAWENNPTFWPGNISHDCHYSCMTIGWKQLALTKKPHYVTRLSALSCLTMRWNNLWSDILIFYAPVFPQKKLWRIPSVPWYVKYKNNVAQKQVHKSACPEMIWPHFL